MYVRYVQYEATLPPLTKELEKFERINTDKTNITTQSKSQNYMYRNVTKNTVMNSNYV
jgi:hypothetical protein